MQNKYLFILILLLFNTNIFAQLLYVQEANKMEHKTSDGKVHKIETLAFSPDAKWLATAGEGNDILIWDLGKNTLERTLKGHSQYINHVVFNQTGDKLASASDDGYVILWHVSTGQILKKIENVPPGNKYKGANFVLFDPTEQ